MNETTTNVADESLRKHNIQDDTKVVATGSHDDTTEDEVKKILTSIVVVRGISKENMKVKCPAKPITPAFPQVEVKKDISTSDLRTCRKEN